MLKAMRYIVVCLMLVSTSAFAQEAWRWVDDKGVVHFSDTPRPGAERVELQSAQGFKPPPDVSASASAQGGAAGTAEGEAFQYDTLEVVSPAEEETLWNIGTELSVSIAMTPSLRPAHRIQLLVDGQSVTEEPVRATQFTVGGVYRGTHTAVVAIVDSDGATLQQSEPVTFFVRQSVQQRPRPTPRAGGG